MRVSGTRKWPIGHLRVFGSEFLFSAQINPTSLELFCALPHFEIEGVWITRIVFLTTKEFLVGLLSILTGSRHALALPVPLGPVHLNSSASVDPRGNSLCIYL